jgi:predicted amidohydrolase
MPLRVAGIQMPVTRNVQANLTHLESAIAWAQTENADILLTPRRLTQWLHA